MRFIRYDIFLCLYVLCMYAQHYTVLLLNNRLFCILFCCRQHMNSSNRANNYESTWTRRFIGAAIIQGAIIVGLTVFLILSQISILKPEVSRVIAGWWCWNMAHAWICNVHSCRCSRNGSLCSLLLLY